MLERILVEDFEELSEYEIRKICLLVTYHDLIGEIIGKDRDLKQLIDVVEDELEFEMLNTLNLADIKAIGNFMWTFNYQGAINGIKEKVLNALM